GTCVAPEFCQIHLNGQPSGQSSVSASAVAGAVVTCGCAAPVVCEPLPDGSGCTDVTCANPAAWCTPTQIHVDPATQVVTVLACDCITFDECHVDLFGPGGEPVWCPGGCPSADEVCNLIGTDTDGDLIDDTFECQCEPIVCQPSADGSACEPVACSLIPEEQCLATCMDYDPVTGTTTIASCDCLYAFDPADCHAEFPPAVSADPNPCHPVDDGTGTVRLPPEGCEYLSPSEVHQIINGLPAGTTIQLDATHAGFFNVTTTPGGSLAGEIETFDSTLTLAMTGTGDLAGFQRNIQLTTACEVHTGPRTPGDRVQSFPNDMVSLSGSIAPGDPDFDQLVITGGTDYGLPSPGHTTLTQLPNGEFAVDSFFDITYRIDFVGAPGSVLDGMSGSTTGTIRMSTGSPPPTCVANCPTGLSCEQTMTTNPDGTIRMCCDCTELTGACCDASGVCTITTEAACLGTYLGDGTSCGGIEACCMPDNTCADMDRECCLNQGGTPQGAGTACTAPVACCFTDGSCQDLDPLCCENAGGTAQGPGSACLGDGNGNGVDDACDVLCPLGDDWCVALQTTDCLANDPAVELCLPAVWRIADDGTGGLIPEIDACRCFEPAGCGSPQLIGMTVIFCPGDCPVLPNDICQVHVNDVPVGDSVDINTLAVGDLVRCGCAGQQLPEPPAIPAYPHSVRKNRVLSINAATNPAKVPAPIAIEAALTSMKRCQVDNRRACIVDADCPDVCTANHDIQCIDDAMCGMSGPCVTSGPCTEHQDVGLIKWVATPVALVSPPDCFPLFDCNNQWVAELVDAPVYRQWTESVIHVTDCEVVPVSTWEMTSVDQTGLRSPVPLTIGTILKPNLNYGDAAGPVDPITLQYTPPDGYVNVIDIQAFLFANGGDLGSPHTTWVDLHGAGVVPPWPVCEPPDFACIIPQRVINVSDLQQIKFGFLGKMYVQTPGQVDPGQCP
ncbi:MAG: hypothetical protein ACE5HE_05695, partial [Phycisphaerae bacterium]